MHDLSVATPTKQDFDKHELRIRKFSRRYQKGDYDTLKCEDFLWEILRSANTVLKYHHAQDGLIYNPSSSDSEYELRPMKAPQMSASKNRSRDDTESSEDEHAPKPFKVPRMKANKKQSRDDTDSNGDKRRSKPHKTPRMTKGKKRSRDDAEMSDRSGDEDISKNAKRPRLGGKMTTEAAAIKALQDLLKGAS